MVTFEIVKAHPAVGVYIQRADDAMRAIGYTEHSFAHVGRTAEQAAGILASLGYPGREVELTRIAGYLHDIGNVINRHDHAHSGAVMAFTLLTQMGMEPDEVATIICAIGNHDEGTGAPVNAVAAALILADKSDVRRSRVRESSVNHLDIHDRVNYAVQKSVIELDKKNMLLTLRLSIDTQQCAVMDYFEIFLSRMLLCRRAAEHLGLTFKLVINDAMLL